MCLTAPTNAKQLEDNLKQVARGPLCEDDMDFMRRFGDAVHQQSRFF